MDSAKTMFRSCGTDIEFSINVEYNGWWLPLFCKVFYIPDGVGILPSTVVLNFLVSHGSPSGVLHPGLYLQCCYQCCGFGIGKYDLMFGLFGGV